MRLLLKYPIYLYLVGIHLLFACGAYYFKGYLLIDSYGYLMQADNIKWLHTGYAENWSNPLLIDYFSIRPPLYAILLLIFSETGFGITLLLIFQAICSIVNLILVYQFVQQIGVVKNIANRLLVIVTLFYPAQFFHVNFVMTEILFQTLLLSCFLNLWSFYKHPTFQKSMLIAVLISLGLLLKPVSLFLPFMTLAFMLQAIRKNKFNWILLTPMLLIGVVFHGICLQNKHATGFYHYSSIKSINHLKYNAKYTLINLNGETFADSTITAIMLEADHQKNYGERLAFMDKASNQIIFSAPITFFKIYIRGLFAFFLDPGRFDAYHYFSIPEIHSPGLMHEMQTDGWSALQKFLHTASIPVFILLAVNFCWNLIMLGLFLYFLTLKKWPLFFRMLTLSWVFYIAVLTGPVGVSRYRVPIFPIMLIGVMCASQVLLKPKPTVDA